jgi:hypothetical protein
MESKQIAKVEPRWHDHLLLVFTDGTQLMVMRDEHRAQGLSHQEASPNTPHAKVTVHHLKPGDWYPPLPPVKEPEVQNAMDTPASEVPAQQGRSIKFVPAHENDWGVTRESEARAQTEGQPSTETPAA